MGSAVDFLAPGVSAETINAKKIGKCHIDRLA